jgi:hypothetical protein
MNIAQALLQTTPSPAEDVRRLGRNIHELTQRYEDGARYFLEALEKTEQLGFSTETLFAIWLDNDVRTLRNIADQIDALRKLMTGHQQ